MLTENSIYYYNENFYYIIKNYSTINKLKKEIIKLNGKTIFEKIYNKKNEKIIIDFKEKENIYKYGKKIK